MQAEDYANVIQQGNIPELNQSEYHMIPEILDLLEQRWNQEYEDAQEEADLIAERTAKFMNRNGVSPGRNWGNNVFKNIIYGLVIAYGNILVLSQAERAKIPKILGTLEVSWILSMDDGEPELADMIVRRTASFMHANGIRRIPDPQTQEFPELVKAEMQWMPSSGTRMGFRKSKHAKAKRVSKRSRKNFRKRTRMLSK